MVWHKAIDWDAIWVRQAGGFIDGAIAYEMIPPVPPLHRFEKPALHPYALEAGHRFFYYNCTGLSFTAPDATP